MIVFFCPDCRGKVEVEPSDVIEGDLLECDLCGAEILVVSESPMKFKLVEEDDF